MKFNFNKFQQFLFEWKYGSLSYVLLLAMYVALNFLIHAPTTWIGSVLDVVFYAFSAYVLIKTYNTFGSKVVCGVHGSNLLYRKGLFRKSEGSVNVADVQRIFIYEGFGTLPMRRAIVVMNNGGHLCFFLNEESETKLINFIQEKQNIQTFNYKRIPRNKTLWLFLVLAMILIARIGVAHFVENHYSESVFFCFISYFLFIARGAEKVRTLVTEKYIFFGLHENIEKLDIKDIERFEIVRNSYILLYLSPTSTSHLKMARENDFEIPALKLYSYELGISLRKFGDFIDAFRRCESDGQRQEVWTNYFAFGKLKELSKEEFKKFKNLFPSKEYWMIMLLIFICNLEPFSGWFF